MKKTLFALALFQLVLSVPSQNASAENWPEFRGKDGLGHTTASNLPVKWSNTENVTWKVPVPGEGWSSPVIWENRIFLTSAIKPENGVDNDRSLRVICYDAKTGEGIWFKELFQQYNRNAFSKHDKNSYASGSPVTDGEYLYVHFGPEGTACLNLDGDIVWKTTDYRFDPMHGTGGSPLIVDDLLVFTCDGKEMAAVVALDRFTGKLRWQVRRPSHTYERKFAFCTPTLIEVNGQKQIVSPGAYVCSTYDPKDGSEIWRVNYEGFSIVPKPMYTHDLVFISTGFGGQKLLQISPEGKGNVTNSHVQPGNFGSVPNTPSFLVVEDRFYMVSDNGVATCLDPVSGKIIWKKRLGGNFSSSPLYGEGKVYFMNENGDCTIIQEGEKFKKLGVSSLGERTFASISVVDSAFIIRTENNLYRIENQ